MFLTARLSEVSKGKISLLQRFVITSLKVHPRVWQKFFCETGSVEENVGAKSLALRFFVFI